MALANNNFSTSTLLGFTNNATDARDDKYDGVNISGSEDLQFYSIIDDVRFAVQATDADIQSKKIKLGFYAGTSGKYTLSILQNELNEDTQVFLEDKLQGIDNWNLLSNNYEFDVEVGDNDESKRVNDRFIISFQENTLSNSDSFNNEDIVMFFSKNILTISKDKSISKVEMVSTIGEVVDTWKGNSSNKYSVKSNLTNGIYIVRAYAKDGVYVKKIMK